LIEETSKPRQNRNTVIVMPPKKVAQLRPPGLPSEKKASSRAPAKRRETPKVPVTTRETRSTRDLSCKTFDAIINEPESVDQPENIDQLEDTRTPLQKLCPELMNMVLELVLTSDEPVQISKSGRHQMPGILQTSRELRKNGLKMYYSSNHFRATVTGEHPEGPMDWAEDIAMDNMRYIPSFTFEYRLTPHDFRMWFLRLSRTDEENRGVETIWRKCARMHGV
jgi:hypothetical protein